MTKPVSSDLRARAVRTYENTKGLTVLSTAKLFGVSKASLGRWLKRRREHGSVVRDAMGGDQRSLVGDEGLHVLQELAANALDATIDDFVELFEERTGVRVSAATMGRALHRAGLSRKKKSSDLQEEIRRRLSSGGACGESSNSS